MRKRDRITEGVDPTVAGLLERRRRLRELRDQTRQIFRGLELLGIDEQPRWRLAMQKSASCSHSLPTSPRRRLYRALQTSRRGVTQPRAAQDETSKTRAQSLTSPGYRLPQLQTSASSTASGLVESTSFPDIR